MLAHLITIFLLLILNAVLVIKLKNHDETTPGDDQTTAPVDDGGKETTAPGKETTAPGKETTAPGKETTAPGKARNKTGMILAVSAAVFVAFAILVTQRRAFMRLMRNNGARVSPAKFAAPAEGAANFGPPSAAAVAAAENAVEKRLKKSAAVKAAVAGVKRRLKRLDAEYYWPEYGPLPRHLQELIDQLPPGATWHEQALAHKARTESLRKLL